MTIREMPLLISKYFFKSPFSNFSNLIMMLPTDKTLTDAIYRLQKIGYNKDFKLVEDKLQCLQNKKLYTPDDMLILGNQRFEGLSNPSDMSALFVIECKDGTKGLIISSFGVYGDIALIDFLDKIKVKKSKNIPMQFAS